MLFHVETFVMKHDYRNLYVLCIVLKLPHHLPEHSSGTALQFPYPLYHVTRVFPPGIMLRGKLSLWTLSPIFIGACLSNVRAQQKLSVVFEFFAIAGLISGYILVSLVFKALAGLETHDRCSPCRLGTQSTQSSSGSIHTICVSVSARLH